MNNALYLSRQSETANPISAGLTWRAVALGIGLAVPSTVRAIHASYVASSSQISVTHLPVAALFPFVCVVLFFKTMSENMVSRPGADRTGTDRHLLHPPDGIRDPRMGVQYVCPFDHQRSALFCFARK